MVCRFICSCDTQFDTVCVCAIPFRQVRSRSPAFLACLSVFRTHLHNCTTSVGVWDCPPASLCTVTLQRVNNVLANTLVVLLFMWLPGPSGHQLSALCACEHASLISSQARPSILKILEGILSTGSCSFNITSNASIAECREVAPLPWNIRRLEMNFASQLVILFSFSTRVCLLLCLEVRLSLGFDSLRCVFVLDDFTSIRLTPDKVGFRCSSFHRSCTSW
jgi:hypothetical protein